MKRNFFAMIPVAAIAAFNNETCEVVLIETANGPVRINKSDFDPNVHTLVKGEEPEQSEQTSAVVAVENAPVAPSAPNLDGKAVAPNTLATTQLLVSKDGTGKNAKFFVTDATGAKVTGNPGVDEAGYASEQDAWAAVMALPR